MDICCNTKTSRICSTVAPNIISAPNTVQAILSVEVMSPTSVVSNVERRIVREKEYKCEDLRFYETVRKPELEFPNRREMSTSSCTCTVLYMHGTVGGDPTPLTISSSNVVLSARKIGHMEHRNKIYAARLELVVIEKGSPTRGSNRKL